MVITHHLEPENSASVVDDNQSNSGNNPSAVAQILKLRDAGLLNTAAFARAMRLADGQALRVSWAKALVQALTLIGTVMAVAGVIFFFAYNWSELHAFTKFGVLAAGIAGGGATAMWRGLDSAIGRAALLGAAVLVGALLAVYGQTYQTGADPYGLFVAWAVLITPWAIAARSRALWMLWIVLANLGLCLYWLELVSPGLRWMSGPPRHTAAFGWMGYTYQDAGLAFVAASFNAVCYAFQEFVSSRSTGWLTDNLVGRQLILFIVVATTVPTFMAIVDWDAADPIRSYSPLAYVLAIALIVVYHLRSKTDLFPVALAYLSLIGVIGTGIVELIGFSFGGFIGLAFIIAAMATAAGIALKTHAAHWRTQS